MSDKTFNIGMIAILALTLLLTIFITTENNSIKNIEVVIIENHEYFKCPSYGFNYSSTHKANCKFCIGENNE